MIQNMSKIKEMPQIWHINTERKGRRNKEHEHFRACIYEHNQSLSQLLYPHIPTAYSTTTFNIDTLIMINVISSDQMC